jgi:hypothetical protein
LDHRGGLRLAALGLVVVPLVRRLGLRDRGVDLEQRGIGLRGAGLVREQRADRGEHRCGHRDATRDRVGLAVRSGGLEFVVVRAVDVEVLA